MKIKHYSIVEKNFNSKFGEIDIIAKKKEIYIFVEVKTRTNYKYGEPLDSINRHKQEKIYKTAEFYLYKNKLNGISIRFDAIEVNLLSYKCEIKHFIGIIFDGKY